MKIATSEPGGSIRDDYAATGHEICAHCRAGGGFFWQLTYAGAPDGAVPVHVKCAQQFFAALDASPFNRPPSISNRK